MQGSDRLLNEVAVSLGTDGAPDDTFDHVHGDLPQAVRRFLDRALTGPGYLDLGPPDDALELGLASGLRVDAYGLGRAVGLGHDLASGDAGLFEHRAPLVIGRGGVGPRPVSRLQRGSDLFLSLRRGRVERRDDVLHDDQDQDDRDGQLNEEGPVGKEEYACWVHDAHGLRFVSGTLTMDKGALPGGLGLPA